VPVQRYPLHHEREGYGGRAKACGAQRRSARRPMKMRGGQEGGERGGGQLTRDVRELAGSGPGGHLARVDVRNAQADGDGRSRDRVVAARDTGEEACAIVEGAGAPSDSGSSAKRQREWSPVVKHPH